MVKEELFLSFIPSPWTKLNVKSVVSESVAVKLAAKVPIDTSSSTKVDVDESDKVWIKENHIK